MKDKRNENRGKQNSANCQNADVFQVVFKYKPIGVKRAGKEQKTQKDI